MLHVFATTLVLLVFILTPAVAPAENLDGDGPLTIEDLYLEQDVDIRIIDSQASSSSRATKSLALQTLQAMLEDGRISPGHPEIVPILRGLALEGTGRKVRQGSPTVVNDFPEIRRSSAQLLGQIGGEDARDALIKVLRDDNEPMVLAEAVYALGLIGSNENNQVTIAIAQMLRNQNSRENPDNNLAYASLLALERIAAATDGIDDVMVIDAVLDIVGHGAYLRFVRLKATETLYHMRGQGR